MPSAIAACSLYATPAYARFSFRHFADFAFFFAFIYAIFPSPLMPLRSYDIFADVTLMIAFMPPLRDAVLYAAFVFLLISPPMPLCDRGALILSVYFHVIFFFSMLDAASAYFFLPFGAYCCCAMIFPPLRAFAAH